VRGVSSTWTSPSMASSRTWPAIPSAESSLPLPRSSTCGSPASCSCKTSTGGSPVWKPPFLSGWCPKQTAVRSSSSAEAAQSEGALRGKHQCCDAAVEGFERSRTRAGSPYFVCIVPPLSISKFTCRPSLFIAEPIQLLPFMCSPVMSVYPC
jgi:hypothetical protein